MIRYLFIFEFINIKKRKMNINATVPKNINESNKIEYNKVNKPKVRFNKL